MLNSRGGFESDLVVVRTGAQEFYLITGTAQAVHDLDWIRSQFLPHERAAVADVTEAWAVLGLMGPNSRAVLAQLTDADLSNEGFPYGTAKQVDIGPASVRAVRLTYVGELGWELHVPASQAVAALRRPAERGHRIQSAAGRALRDQLLADGKRLPRLGAELSPDDTPLEAGLGFAIVWEHDFLGRDALEKQRAAGVRRRLGLFVLDDPDAIAWGGEPILRDGATVGYTTSAAYGHTLGASVVMGYVNYREPLTNEFLRAGRHEINVSGERIPAALHLRARYDAERKRVLS